MRTYFSNLILPSTKITLQGIRASDFNTQIWRGPLLRTWKVCISNFIQKQYLSFLLTLKCITLSDMQETLENVYRIKKEVFYALEIATTII